MLASAHQDGSIKLWRLNGTLQQILKGHKGPVNMVHFSPGGQRLASASNDQTIRLWNLDGSLIYVLTGHRAATTAISFIPDGQKLASVGGDRTVKLWQVQRRALQTIGDRHTITSLSSNGRVMATGNRDGLIQL
jgi:WD40 repeat protein